MEQGDFFFNKACPEVPSHPWIILSDPTLNESDVLIVNLTDAAKHHDASCELTSSDHFGITKPSRVAYQFAKVTSVEKLQAAFGAGLMFNKSQLSQATLGKVLDGARDTDELKNAHRELLRRQNLI